MRPNKNAGCERCSWAGGIPLISRKPGYSIQSMPPAACLDSILALTRLASDKTASPSGGVPRGLRMPASLNSWGLGSQLKMEIICHHPSLLKHYKDKFV